jgi:hypothetical protein
MLSLLFGLLTITFAQVKEDRFLLEQIRSEIRVPDYSDSERQTLIEQSLLIFKDWNVNELIKHPLHQNALENEILIQELQTQGSRLPIEIVLDQISRLYTTQFDGHLNFYYPKPMACFASEIPVRFNLAQDAGPNRFFISGLKDYRVLNADGSIFPLPELASLNLGDELIRYNGKSVDEYLQELQKNKILPVANARPRLARSHMIWRNHSLIKMPTENQVQFRLRKISGQEYEVQIPWLVRKTASCLQQPNTSTEVSSPIWDLGVISSVNELKILSDRNEANLPIDKVMPVDPKLGYGWGYYRKGNEKFGYFRLESFSPSIYVNGATSRDHHQLLLQFQRIFRSLNNEAQVKGLIIDVRDNPGGSLLLSAAMIQSFTSKPVLASRYRWKASASTARFLDFAVNEKNMDHMTTQNHALQTAYLQGLPFSSPNTLWETDDLMAKQYGQVFFKPVTVITNASCYSSCDNFAALMQDHEAGRIIGEDSATGGGGANVWDHAAVLRDYNPLPPELRLRPMPHGQNMRMPIRHIVRLGDEKLLLEDVGVVSDEVVPVSREDILQQSSKVLEQAAAYLAQQNDGVHRPVSEEPQSIWFDVLDGPQKLNLRSALVWDQSLFKNKYSITENEYVVHGLRAGEYSLGTHQRLIMGLARKDQNLGKLRFRLNLKSEACCDRVLIGVRTSEAGEKWLASYSGEINGMKELSLGLGSSEKFELLVTTSTDFGVSKGQISISDLEIF